MQNLEVLGPKMTKLCPLGVKVLKKRKEKKRKRPEWTYRAPMELKNNENLLNDVVVTINY